MTTPCTGHAAESDRDEWMAECERIMDEYESAAADYVYDEGPADQHHLTIERLDAARAALLDRIRREVAPSPAEVPMPEPVVAQHRFRHPEKVMPGWSIWQPCIVRSRPAREIDSAGYQVEYRTLFTQEQMRTYGDARDAAGYARGLAREWQPIETAPKTGKKIILWYTNRNNLARTVMAQWLTDEQAAENDFDGVGLEGGWYECIDNWDEYTKVAINQGDPSHWMPLPKPPTAALRGEVK